MVQLDSSSLIIGEMKIDSDGVLKAKCNNEWISVCADTPTISNIHTHDTVYTIEDTVSHHYLDMHVLQEYDKKIKEYIDKRISERLANITSVKYKIITGEDF